MPCGAVPPGIDSAKSMDNDFSPASGGWPRPSFRWQSWQARELYKGPSPSDASVDAGAATQFLRNRPLPTLKSSSVAKSIVPEGCENASAPARAGTVAAPAGKASDGSGLVKSTVRPVAVIMRASSSGVRAMTDRCRSSKSAPSADCAAQSGRKNDPMMPRLM